MLVSTFRARRKALGIDNGKMGLGCEWLYSKVAWPSVVTSVHALFGSAGSTPSAQESGVTRTNGEGGRDIDLPFASLR
jgi:hypothetical protein